jgi:hypothetical protein
MLLSREWVLYGGGRFVPSCLLSLSFSVAFLPFAMGLGQKLAPGPWSSQLLTLKGKFVRETGK